MKGQFNGMNNNCTEVNQKICNLKQPTNTCPYGYHCYDVGAVDENIGICFRDKDNCKGEHIPCCDSTDCCRRLSSTNTSPLNCVETINGYFCRVLI